MLPFLKNMPTLKIDADAARQPRTGRQPACGFTLLEVMVAMAIMAIVLVSVYRMHAQTLAMNTATRFYTQAPLLAAGKLAELEASPTQILDGQAGDFGDAFAGYRYRISSNDTGVEILGESGRDLRRVDITVSYNDDEYTYNLRTYLYARP